MSEQCDFKSFYVKICKEKPDFEPFKDKKIRRSGETVTILNNIINNYVSDIYQNINNEYVGKMVTLEMFISALRESSKCEILEEAIEFGEKCSELHTEFKNNQKENKDKSKTKNNISVVCGLILPITRIKKLIKQNSQFPK